MHRPADSRAPDGPFRGSRPQTRPARPPWNGAPRASQFLSRPAVPAPAGRSPTTTPRRREVPMADGNHLQAVRLPRRRRQAARAAHARDCGAATEPGAPPTAAGTTSSNSRRAPTAPAAPRCAAAGSPPRPTPSRNWTRPGNCWPSPPPATPRPPSGSPTPSPSPSRETRHAARPRPGPQGGRRRPRPRHPPAHGRRVAGGMAGCQEEPAPRHGPRLRQPHPAVLPAAHRAHQHRPAPGHRRRLGVRGHRRTQRGHHRRPRPAETPLGGPRSRAAGPSAPPPGSGSAPRCARRSAPT